MLKKFQKFQNSGIYGQAGGKFLKSLEFFEHYSVSWALRQWKIDFFWALQCFVAWTSQNTVMLKKINFSQPQSSQNLSIAVFRGLNLTKHCNAQKNQLFQALKLMKHCNAQKIPKS